MPATPASTTRLTDAPNVRVTNAGSAATGSSLVPAEITATSPAAPGRSPSRGHLAGSCASGDVVGDSVGERGADRVTHLIVEPGGECGPSVALPAQRVEKGHDL